MRGVTAPLKAADWLFISLANDIASFLNSSEGRKKEDHLSGRREL